MIAIEFGPYCFNNHSNEESIVLIIAPKNLYSSMDEFVVKAVDFLSQDGDFCDGWADMYNTRSYSEVSEEDKNWMRSRLDEIGRRVHIVFQSIISAVHIVPPKWNDITIGVETEEEYIFYSWGTSA